MKKVLSLILLSMSVFIYGQTNFPNSVTVKSSPAGPGATNQSTDTLIATLNSSTMKLGYKTNTQVLNSIGAVYDRSVHIIKASSVSNIRNDQPAFVTLDNGNILCAFGFFGASGSDSSTAYIAGSISTDGGKTWGTSFPLQTNISGALSTRVPSLYKRPDGKILMMYNVLTSPVPTPASKIYKTVFNQDFTVFQAASDIGLSSGYYPSGSDRLYYDSVNSTLLLPASVLVSGPGTSYESLYKSTILKSTDQGQTWTDLNLSIGLTKTILSNIGGGVEPGVFYTPQGLVCYFRNLQGYTWGVKLDGSYAPTGSEYQLYSAANAQSSIKYIPSKNIIVAACTRQTNNNPIGDNYRKYIDLLTSSDGIHFSKLDEIDYAIQTTDYYVNQPIIHDSKDNIIVGYSISQTAPLTASLLNKVYPKSFIQYSYSGDYYNGISDNGTGKIYNGIQEINSIDNTRNFVSLRNPKGGYYSSLSSSVTGAIKITLPNNKNSYITIRGNIYENSSDKSISFEISCNSSNMAINNIIVKGNEITKDLNVRFVDGATPVIFIGDLASNWVYPQVVISEVSAGFNSYLSELAENWKIAIEPTSYGTVVSTKNQINSANIKNATVTISDSPGGINLKLTRGAFGTIFSTSSTVDGYIAYSNSTSTARYRLFGDTGNSIFGTSIGTDTGYKVDVQGTFRASGTAVAATATLPTELPTKAQMDALDAQNIKQNGNSFTGAPVSIGSNNAQDVQIRRNSTILATFGASGITLASSTYALIGNLINSIDNASSIRIGQVSGANAETRITRTSTGADANAALNIYYDNTSATGDILNATSTNGGTSVKWGVRNDGRSYGTNAVATNDFVTNQQLTNAVKLENSQTKSASYTVVSTDYGANGYAVFYVNATSAAVTITLDTPANMLNRNVKVIKTDSSANTVTVKGNGSTNINGANTFLLTAQYSNTVISSNGTQYYIF